MNSSLLSDKIGSLSLDASPPPSLKWQHFIYDCKDFPIHDHYNNNSEECQFCIEVKNMQSSKQSNFESKEIMQYIKEGGKFSRTKEMESFVEKAMKDNFILPNHLAKSVSFNRKLGDAFFRDGITPNNEHPSNVLGGYFQLLLLGTTGNKELLEKFDKIFNKIFKMTANELEKGKPFANAINGIFIRCEINPGKFIENVNEAYNDLLNLPFMLKIQIWIGNNWNQAMVKKELIGNIELELGQMMDELPEEMFRFREFQYHLADPDRIRLRPFESPDKPLPKYHGNCQVNECPYCIGMSKHFEGKKYREESLEWKDYFKEDQLIQTPNLMVEFIKRNKEKILPSFLAKSISFDRKLGAALFRNGIEPNYEHPLNAGGGFFRAFLNGTTGNEESLAKFDQIFHLLIVEMANSSKKDSINGIFIRCMINQDTEFNNDYSNPTNLPFTLWLEVWIRKCSRKQLNNIEEALNKNIVEKAKQMGLLELFTFKYNIHVENLIKPSWI